MFNSSHILNGLNLNSLTTQQTISKLITVQPLRMYMNSLNLNSFQVIFETVNSQTTQDVHECFKYNMFVRELLIAEFITNNFKLLIFRPSDRLSKSRTRFGEFGRYQQLAIPSKQFQLFFFAFFRLIIIGTKLLFGKFFNGKVRLWPLDLEEIEGPKNTKSFIKTDT